jgi:hypothetical protein
VLSISQKKFWLLLKKKNHFCSNISLPHLTPTTQNPRSQFYSNLSLILTFSSISLSPSLITELFTIFSVDLATHTQSFVHLSSNLTQSQNLSSHNLISAISLNRRTSIVRSFHHQPFAELQAFVSVPTISLSITVTILVYHYLSVRFTLEYHS